MTDLNDVLPADAGEETHDPATSAMRAEAVERVQNDALLSMLARVAVYTRAGKLNYPATAKAAGMTTAKLRSSLSAHELLQRQSIHRPVSRS